jgi:hypothetical protein
MITNILKQKIINFVIDNIDYCSYEINGALKRKDIFRVISEGNSLNIKVKFDDLDEGEIKNLKIIDSEGDIILTNDNVFNKPSGKSLIVSFNLNDVIEVIG